MHKLHRYDSPQLACSPMLTDVGENYYRTAFRNLYFEVLRVFLIFLFCTFTLNVHVGEKNPWGSKVQNVLLNRVTILN